MFSNESESITEEIPLHAQTKMAGYIYSSSSLFSIHILILIYSNKEAHNKLLYDIH